MTQASEERVYSPSATRGHGVAPWLRCAQLLFLTASIAGCSASSEDSSSAAIGQGDSGGGAKSAPDDERETGDAGSGSASEQAAEAEVRATVMKYNAAFNASFEGPADFATEDWNNINPYGGWTRGRDQVVAEIRDVRMGILRGVVETIDDMAIRFATDDVAVVTATNTLTSFVTPDGVMHTNQPMRATFVLVKRDGGWLVMHHHVTVIA